MNIKSLSWMSSPVSRGYHFFAYSMLGALLAGNLCLSACAVRQPSSEGMQPQNAAGEVADISRIPQSLSWFARQTPDHLLRSSEEAQQDSEHFRQKFFSAWDVKRASASMMKDFVQVLGWKSGHRGYAENMRPWTDAAWESMCANANMEHFPSMHRAGITTQTTDLRLAPTLRPRFAHIQGAGQGWPFDDFQQSSLPLGLPVMVHHVSRDGAWLFVECSLASGWVRADSVAFADEDMQSFWRESELATVVGDGIPLRRQGSLIALADMGTVLPLSDQGLISVPVREAHGNAGIVQILRNNALQPFVLPMPQPLTAQTLADIGDRLMGQSYGWGGLYGDRDCSSTMRDLFAAFGIWLPRNSAAQAKTGTFVNLEGLSAAEKSRRILRDGIPFKTLLWMKGHIGLYVGSFQGEPVFFHNLWGIRNTLPDGREGRIILGRAVVTSLHPGQERGDVKKQNLLVERLRGMTFTGSRKD